MSGIDVDKLLGRVPSEKLLGEVRDLIRSMPDNAGFGTGARETLQWIGRLAATARLWDSVRGDLKFQTIGLKLRSPDDARRAVGIRDLTALLYEMEYDLVLKSDGGTTIVVEPGKTYQYFDELRRVIEAARKDLLFVDPYLDADFVSRYLPSIHKGVAARLLTSDRKIKTLVPAVTEFVRESGSKVEVRVASGLHDRYLFVDSRACYQSGASFKDGAARSATTITQIVDALEPIQNMYEHRWQEASIL